ncbi:MAG: phenylacetate-CoA oxygenase subunit PaaJ [Alphaproteobacteria bacterium]|nr:phenylacetate-CoA oxygenase subunit PaaJ [Alphaproteobacteria bacterium]MCY4317597.1 phenylacetate-CoA oxygenase subunit PaaJ [Alphaproteobacteria bacterium]
MVSRVKEVRRLVEAVPDPEIPVLTIGDLGLVRAVEEEGGSLIVRLTPTYSGCPASDVIRRDVEAALASGGFADAVVETRLAPAWTTDWMSEAGKAKLAAYGIAPPAYGPVLCPHCSSAAVEELSRFGATPCKALWRCLDCREPFERFKCL